MNCTFIMRKHQTVAQLGFKKTDLDRTACKKITIAGQTVWVCATI